MDLVGKLVAGLEELDKRGIISVFDRAFDIDGSALPDYKQTFWNKIDDDTNCDFQNFMRNLCGDKVICIGLIKTYMHYGDYSCSHFTNAVFVDFVMDLMTKEKYSVCAGVENSPVLIELGAQYREIRQLVQEAGRLTDEIQHKYSTIIYQLMQYLAETLNFKAYFIWKKTEGKESKDADGAQPGCTYILDTDTYRNKVFLLKGITETHSTLESIRMMKEDNITFDENESYNADELVSLSEINEFGLTCNIKSNNGLYPLFNLRIERNIIPYIEVLDLKNISNIDNLGEDARYVTYITCCDTLLGLMGYTKESVSKEVIRDIMMSHITVNYPLPRIISVILARTTIT